MVVGHRGGCRHGTRFDFTERFLGLLAIPPLESGLSNKPWRSIALGSCFCGLGHADGCSILKAERLVASGEPVQNVSQYFRKLSASESGSLRETSGSGAKAACGSV